MPVAEKNSVTDTTSNLVHVGIILNAEVLDDEALALGGVVAHVILQQLLDAEVVLKDDWLEAYVGTDEATELVGGDSAQAFVAGDLGLLAAFLLGGDAFLVSVTIVGLFFVAHTKQGCLQDMDMDGTHEGGIELEEEGEHQ